MSEETSNVNQEVESSQGDILSNDAAPQAETSAVESSFLENLSDELKGEASLKDFKSVEDLAKSYVHQSRMVGNSLRIPGEDAGEEQWNEFYDKFKDVPGLMRAPNIEDRESMEQVFNKLGRPETPDGYDIEVPEEILAVEGESIKDFYKVAHDLGLTKAQVSKLVESRSEDIKQNLAAAEQAKAESEQVLRKQWGHEYDKRLAGAKLALRHYSESYQDAVNDLLASGASNNPALITMLSEMGRVLQENGHVSGENTVQYGTSPKEALETIDEIRGNRSHPYNDVSSPEHQAAVKRVQQLYNIAYSGK